MAHVITQSCCNDASCLSVCPVNCIHPTPDEPDFATAEMLYIDPATCIDCGACVDECPVSAIQPDDRLDANNRIFLQLNAAYYTDHTPVRSKPVRAMHPALATELHVAIVGGGPAAFYAADDLLRNPGVRVDMFERLPTPYGLVRAGVAPDHQSTKRVENAFAATAARSGFRYFLNTEVGVHVTHDELRERYHAVLYASGASTDRRLDVPGEDVPGSIAATDFVAWYNGHPDYAGLEFDLSTPTAVIVGNGNVALDVARILVSGPDRLARTDIADHALDALKRSNVTEVVVLGRRGVAQAAYTNAEFVAMGQIPCVDVIIDPDGLVLDPSTAAALAAGTLDSTIAAKIRIARDFADRTPTAGSRRIAFRYLVSPAEITGGSAVTSITCVRNEFTHTGGVVATPVRSTVTTGIVIRAIGYRGRPIPPLPFDAECAVVPNDRGAVTDEPGVYVAGWIKRGPSGGIGMNRLCGQETAGRILADHAAGLLESPIRSRDDIVELVVARGGTPIDGDGWDRIDAHEKAAGRMAGRRRVKLVDRTDLETAARP
ncbi:FAD-dependent oxidoreductase [Antrihabitans stalactiti]|uniref:ferredoxin--NADP(+) reductase n=1 Tax=Antrihabitans stalactiti TaxID=2584121 RepID=A0A848KLL0_9NOCA|nr:FAD-dependent oxidoreductase [Antrihabitans stalactiti]NMN99149.1 ferredoxin [Antrihabitans stalactiti]